ncbi:MAG: response regulator [Candidatus Peregrinibacteria bacterium]
MTNEPARPAQDPNEMLRSLYDANPECNVVLLVDDDAMLRTAVRQQLGLCLRDFGINYVSSAQEAIDALKRGLAQKVTLVLSDIEMPPGMKGTKLAEFLRFPPDSDSGCQLPFDIPIVLMSGNPSYKNPKTPEGKSMAGLIDAGVVDGFVAKPFSTEDLKAAICRAVESALEKQPEIVDGAKDPAGEEVIDLTDEVTPV